MSSWSYRLIFNWHLKSKSIYFKCLLKSHSTLCALGRSSSLQNKDFCFLLSVQHMRWPPASMCWCQQLRALRFKINYSGREHRLEAEVGTGSWWSHDSIFRKQRVSRKWGWSPLPPRRFYSQRFYNLSKQFHRLGTENSEMWACEGLFKFKPQITQWNPAL